MGYVLPVYEYRQPPEIRERRSFSYEVAVVGAGMAGLAAALEIFDRHGVAARILAKGVTWNEGEVYRGSERLYRFNLQPEADQKFPAFVNLQQFYVEQCLVERLQQIPEGVLQGRAHG